MENQKTYVDGDIVEVVKKDGSFEEMLLLRCHSKYATSVILKDKPQGTDSYPVISRQQMFFDAGRPCYVFYGAITELIKSIPEEELNRCRMKVAEAIGLPRDSGNGCVFRHEGQDTDCLDIDSFETAMNEVAEKIDEMLAGLKEKAAYPNTEKMAQLKAERDAYKKLYEQEILQRIVYEQEILQRNAQSHGEDDNGKV